MVIDPGQAFGTGAHPTTRLSLGLLLDLHDRGRAGGPLTDLGTGSAVLAIAAAKLGWGPVAGYDHEAAAIEAAIENAEVNAVEVRTRARRPARGSAGTRSDRRRQPDRAAAGDGRLADDGSTTGRNGLVCSGLLETERERVEAAFGRLGLAPVDFRAMEGWGGLLLEARVSIGFIDSGVGGLTVLHECLVSLPQEDFLYVGDSGHFPYGTKTPEELRDGPV